MRKLFYQLLSVLLMIFPFVSRAQTVTIDYQSQRYIGDVSTLDRPTYFTFHGTANDADIQTFFQDYNTYPGRGFWGAFSVAKQQTGEVGEYPALQGSTGILGNVQRGIQTEHPYNVFVDGMDTKAAAAWAADYYINKVDDNSRPEYFEPMNEPFVHTSDFGTNAQDIKRQMSELFRDIGYKFDNSPELANMKVVGYSAAWASLELWDFRHWEENQKLFMDIAGEHMDAFATHLYDGVNVTGQDNNRSGSNADAILDLIETYSYTKWGIVKPHAITEYGAIEKGYGSNYSDLASIQSVRSQNHLLFGLLEREDRMAISIPFNTAKAEWHITEANNYQPYQAATWKPTNIGEPNPAGWEYTPRIEFYKLWKDVAGDRVLVRSDHPDIQVQAFVNGNKLYLALNNLDNREQHVKLNMLSPLSGLQNVKIKALKIYPDVPYDYTENTTTNAPSEIALIAGETAILEYTFGNSISYNNTIRSKNYYTSKHLENIQANTPISFTFNNVETGSGYAKVKMTIGRKHDVSKTPEVKVNGTIVPVPANVKGYDQANREDFFGTIDIPVPMELIKANNTISFSFPDAGGRLASVILNIEKFDTDVNLQGSFPSVYPLAIPATIEAENYDTGGESVAYHDLDATNSGGEYRTENGVDISKNAKGDLYLSSVQSGEWLEYSIDVPGDGQYELQSVASAIGGAASFRVEFNGEDKTGSVTLNPDNTGAWSTTSHSINLLKGENIMRLIAESGELNVDKFIINSEVSVQGIKIGQDSLLTRVDKTAKLSAEILPFYAKDKSMSWTSTDTSIAQVNDEGLVSAISEGEASIIVYSSGQTYSDSCMVKVQPALKDTAYFAEPIITSYQLGEPIKAQVNYVASEISDIYIELYNPDRTQWLGNAKATVAEGIGSVEVSIERNTPLPADQDYQLSASIRPEGTGWQQIKASQRIYIDIIEAVKVGFINLPQQMNTAKNLSFDVYYQTDTARDIYVELYSPGRSQWLGNAHATVAAGKDTVTISLDLNNAPEAAKDYEISCDIRPVGTNWQHIITSEKKLIELVAQSIAIGLQNSSFESGDFTGWSHRSAAIQSLDAFEGTYAAQVEGGGAVSQVIDVEAGKTYVLSGVTKIVSGNRGDLAVQTWPGKQWLKTIAINTTEWTEKETSFVVPENVDQVNVYVYMPNGNSARADQIQLLKRVAVNGIAFTPSESTLGPNETQQVELAFVPQDANNKKLNFVSLNENVASVNAKGEVKGLRLGKTKIIATALDGGFSDTLNLEVTHPNLVENAGFETGDISAYSNWNPILVQDEEVFAGKYSARVNGPASVGQRLFNLKPNTRYELSAYAKITAPGMKSYLGVKNYGGIEKGAGIVNTEFTKLSLTFTTDSIGTAQIYLFSPAGSNAIGDNLRLRESSIQAVAFSSDSIVLQKGERSRLEVQVSTEEPSLQQLSWHSTAPNVAVISDKGNLTTLERGDAQIIASSVYDPSLSDTLKLRVWHQSPFASHLLPGIIELEDYDEGGENIAYFDNTPQNSGNTYRNEGVDIKTTDDLSGQYQLTDVQAGEWVEYELDVTQADEYYFFVRLSAEEQSIIELAFEDLDISSTIAVTPTSGWATLASDAAINLPAGKHIMKLTMLSGSAELNFIEVNVVSQECSNTSAWDAGKTYTSKGEEVIFEGKRYASQYYTQGDYPGQSDAWKLLGYCNAAPLDCYNTLDWNVNTIYPETGTQVRYQGNIYRSQWYVSAGQQPGISEVWKLQGPCTASSLNAPPSSCPDVAPWTSFAEYTYAGTEVTHLGVLYANQWHASAGQEPGLAEVWKPIAPCSPVYEVPACPEVAVWSAEQVYAQQGAQVLHKGAVFSNQYYASAGQEPGKANVWHYQYSCNSDSVVEQNGGLLDDQALILFPNPLTEGELNIYVNTENAFQISITDISSQVVYTAELKPTNGKATLDVKSALVEGVYFVNIQLPEKHIVTKLIVN